MNSYLGIDVGGTKIAAGHHNSHFDFNEDCLWKAAATVTEIAVHFSNK